MDALVKAAMAKWPNVPDCFGWLGLDARGDWYMRDDAAQHAGPFPTLEPATQEPTAGEPVAAMRQAAPDGEAAALDALRRRAARGSRIEHAQLIAFIGRNYAVDPNRGGAFFFQNGPQRVYVELAAAPWIWRLGAPLGASAASAASVVPTVRGHTGTPAGAVTGCFTDAQGRLYLATELGFGLVHTQDIETAAHAVEAGLWTPQPVSWEELPERFGFRRSPAADAARGVGAAGGRTEAERGSAAPATPAPDARDGSGARDAGLGAGGAHRSAG